MSSVTMHELENTGRRGVVERTAKPGRLLAFGADERPPQPVGGFLDNRGQLLVLLQRSIFAAFRGLEHFGELFSCRKQSVLDFDQK